MGCDVAIGKIEIWKLEFEPNLRFDNDFGSWEAFYWCGEEIENEREKAGLAGQKKKSGLKKIMSRL